MSTRRPTSLTLDAALLDEAKALGLNVSRAAEEGGLRAVKALRAKIGTAGGGLTAPVFWFGDREYQVILSQLGTARLADLGARVGTLSHLREDIARGI